jgi:hypothetical protein
VLNDNRSVRTSVPLKNNSLIEPSNLTPTSRQAHPFFAAIREQVTGRERQLSNDFSLNGGSGRAAMTRSSARKMGKLIHHASLRRCRDRIQRELNSPRIRRNCYPRDFNGDALRKFAKLVPLACSAT